MKQITIGDKLLKQISKEDVLQIAIIQGCCPCMDYWNYPDIIDFTNTMFSDSVVLDYRSIRKKDELLSDVIVFFFHFNDLTFHWHKGHTGNGAYE
jgi:hypothetical protein